MVNVKTIATDAVPSQLASAMIHSRMFFKMISMTHQWHCCWIQFGFWLHA